VQKAGAIFDLDKFQWMAGEYLRASRPKSSPITAHRS
jgi:hypothetical protein